ncbi:MAG: hypothetical protein J6V58_04415 [Clostridia bacterium]|nr:hypothetical protein [Clostridia bacterium]
MKYCQNCGAEINENAVICVKCGCSVSKSTVKKEVKPKFFFISSVVSFVLSIISAFIADYINSTQLTGNAVATMRAFGNYAGVRSYETRADMQIVFAYAFLVFLALGLTMLIIGIVKKIKSRREKTSVC